MLFIVYIERVNAMSEGRWLVHLQTLRNYGENNQIEESHFEIEDFNPLSDTYNDGVVHIETGVTEEKVINWFRASEVKLAKSRRFKKKNSQRLVKNNVCCAFEF